MTHRKLWRMSPIPAALGLVLALAFAGCDNPAGNGGTTTPQFAISLNATGHIFPPAHAGYTVGAGAGNVNPFTVTVTNTGNEATDLLNLAISGAGFTLSGTTIPNIAVGGSQQFTVEPNAGLGFGSYSAIITITRAAGGMTPASLAVSFTVTNPDATQLAAPVISLAGSVVSWSPVSGATGYNIYAGNAVIGQTDGTSFDLTTANPALAAGTHQITVIAVGNPATHNPSPRSNEVSFTVAAPPPGGIGQTLNLTGQVWEWGNDGLTQFTGNIPGITSEIGGSGAVTSGQLNFTLGAPAAGYRQSLSEMFAYFGMNEMFNNFTINPPTARGAILEGLTVPGNRWLYRFNEGDDSWEQVLYLFVEQQVTISGTGTVSSMVCDCSYCGCVEWDGECFCDWEMTTTSFNITLTSGWNPLLSRMVETDGGITMTISRGDPAHLRWVLDEGPTSPLPPDLPLPGPGEPLILTGEVWELDFMTGQSSRFTGSVQLTGTGSGAITNGHLSYSVPAPSSSSLWNIADDTWFLPESTTFSDPTVRGLILDAWSNDPTGGISRMYIESFNWQDSTLTAFLEEVMYIFVDRPVTIYSPSWNFGGSHGGGSYWTDTGNAFNITLSQGWNAVHQRIAFTGSETMESRHTIFTTLANPGHLRWYWGEWEGGWWCGCDDGDCQYFSDCDDFCEGGQGCGRPSCHCTPAMSLGEGTGERSMRAAPSRSQVHALRNLARTLR